jgi:hypothetical protein
MAMTSSGFALWADVPATLPGMILLFCYALLFALVEIEIEGKDGWAMNLPTWYRRKPVYARIYALMLSGKPLTGYHAVMFFIPFVSFHIGLAFGQAWSWGLEARVIASYLVWNVTWDFLCFVLNPHFGWARFRKGQIWWHGGIWVGRMPIDCPVAVVLGGVRAVVRARKYQHPLPTRDLRERHGDSNRGSSLGGAHVPTLVSAHATPGQRRAPEGLDDRS